MEQVIHPDHYNKSGRKECILEMEEIFGTEAVILFCKMNSYKYRYRYDLKGGDIDIEKANNYEKMASEFENKNRGA